MADVQNGSDAALSVPNPAGDVSAVEDNGVDDPELEAIKSRVREMEAEAEKLKEMQTEVEKQMIPKAATTTTSFPSPEEKIEADARSIYVGNVDYSATAEELEQHFHGCGSVNRVTILCDKFSGHPKGFAYVEFADKDSVVTATALDESLFRGRQIKVNAKRTNRPGISTTNRRPGRGGRSRGARARGGGNSYGSAGYVGGGGYGGGYPGGYGTGYGGGFAGGYAPRARPTYGDSTQCGKGVSCSLE